MKEEIKLLHDLGFSILWLATRSKRPIEKAWTKLDRHEWNTLQTFYKPGFNVGVKLGTASKLEDGNFLAVIDCDVKSEDPVHQKEMERALDGLGFDWATAPTVLSGRGNGSRHIYCKTKEPLKPFRVVKSAHPVKVLMPSATNTPSKKDEELLTNEEIAQGYRIRPAWEISAMGTGQQVVLPPSVHPDTGGKYTWKREVHTTNDLPLVELTEKLQVKSLLRVSNQSPKFEPVTVDLICSKLPDWAVDMILSGAHIDERYNGDRSAAILGLCMSMVSHDFTDLEIMSVLTDPANEIAWVAYEHRKTRDRANAADWIYKYNIVKARTEKSAAKAFENIAIIEDQFLPEDKALEQKEDLLGDWQDQLDRNFQTGAPKPTLKNIILILKNCSEKPIFAFNEFFNSEFYLSNPPWKRVDSRSYVKRELADRDITDIKAFLSIHFGVETNDGLIVHAISAIARNKTVHPVREYLHSLKWDGVKRLDTWLKDYMNAEGPEEYLQAVGKKLLTACVGRVFEPGVKWDYVVVFEGNQGVGKSTACSILGGAWFSDTLGDINNKDVVDNIRGKWVIEIGELAVMRKAEVEHLKHFITVKVDRVRKAYARKSEDYARQCVFIGTTNKDEYLKDETGNRRFWPVKVDQVKFDQLTKDRDQLWAEAVECWFNLEPLFLDKKLEAIANEEQAMRMELDEWSHPIGDILNKSEFFPEMGFKLIDLWKEFARNSDIDGTKFSRDAQFRLARVVRGLGYRQKSVRKNGGVEKFWAKR